MHAEVSGGWLPEVTDYETRNRAGSQRIVPRSGGLGTKSARESGSFANWFRRSATKMIVPLRGGVNEKPLYDAAHKTSRVEWVARLQRRLQTPFRRPDPHPSTAIAFSLLPPGPRREGSLLYY